MVRKIQNKILEKIKKQNTVTLARIPRIVPVKPDNTYELPKTYVSESLELAIVVNKTNSVIIYMDHLIKNNKIYIPKMSLDNDLFLKYEYMVNVKMVEYKVDDYNKEE